MKLPRWLVISLLSVSVLAVLGAAAWWWVIWPERTARKFSELLQAEKFDESNRMLNLDVPEVKATSKFVFLDHPNPESIRFPILKSRTWTDYVLGRVRFLASQWPQWWQEVWIGEEYVAVRGRVECQHVVTIQARMEPFDSANSQQSIGGIVADLDGLFTDPDVKPKLGPTGKGDSPITPEASPKEQ